MGRRRFVGVLLNGSPNEAAPVCKCTTVRNSRIVGELNIIMPFWVGDFEMGRIYLKQAKECCNTYCCFVPLVTCVHDCLELSAG